MFTNHVHTVTSEVERASFNKFMFSRKPPPGPALDLMLNDGKTLLSSSKRAINLNGSSSDRHRPKVIAFPATNTYIGSTACQRQEAQPACAARYKVLVKLG